MVDHVYLSYLQCCIMSQKIVKTSTNRTAEIRQNAYSDRKYNYGSMVKRDVCGQWWINNFHPFSTLQDYFWFTVMDDQKMTECSSFFRQKTPPFFCKKLGSQTWASIPRGWAARPSLGPDSNWTSGPGTDGFSDEIRVETQLTLSRHGWDAPTKVSGHSSFWMRGNSWQKTVEMFGPIFWAINTLKVYFSYRFL